MNHEDVPTYAGVLYENHLWMVCHKGDVDSSFACRVLFSTWIYPSFFLSLSDFTRHQTHLLVSKCLAGCCKTISIELTVHEAIFL